MMKKVFIFILALGMLFVMTACGSKIPLEENQIALEIHDDGTATLTMFLDEEELDIAFELDIDDDIDDMFDELDEYYDDIDIDIEVRSIVIKDNMITLVIVFEDIGDLGIGGEDNLDDLIDDWDYEDAEAFADDWPFVTYEDEEDVRPRDMEDYEDLIYLEIEGIYEEGTYVTVPGDIILVDVDLDFEYYSKRTILVEGGLGWILYEE